MRPPLKSWPVILVAAGLAGLVGCATAPPPPATPPQSLYDRLGGKGAITAVVGEFLTRVGKDGRINAQFANADMPHLNVMLVEQICQATGGPCKYTGKDMKAAHVGMKITGADFDALVEDLKGALDKFNVPAPVEGDLLGALGAMKPDIVTSSDALARAPGQAADPVLGRAHDLRDAAGLLDKADGARLRADRSLADELFSSAELLTGPGAVADLVPLFREGAPPRVTTALTSMPLNSPPQPPLVGSSEQEEPDAKPARGSLSGVVVGSGGEPLHGVAVITLEPTSGKFHHRTPKQRVMEQRNREFAPRVLVVPVGSTVSFPNFDNIFHNVFSSSETHPFDLGIYKSGQARELVFDKEGIVRVGCNLHANMSAHVVVVSAPHYVITDAQGHFAFRSLEPGRYHLRVWSEETDKPQTQEIEIRPDRNATTLKLVADRSAGPLPDKFGVPRAGATRR